MAFTQKNRNNTRFKSMPNFRRIDSESFDENGAPIVTKLYRSSRPDFLTESEALTFRQLGIRSIIDFRSVKEYKKANGSKLLDRIFPVYKVQLPFYKRYTVNDRIAAKPLNSFPSIPKSSAENGFKENGSYGVKGKHYLVNFFKMNYILAVYNRAPWYLKLYSLLFLMMDIVLNTGFNHFVRLFARNVLNKAGLVGQYLDMMKYSQNQIYAALKLLCDPENVPAMLNCAHGKDRTGIVSALVLVCFGKSKEYISLDYARSEVELEPMKDRLHTEIVKKFHMCETFTSAKAANMMQVLNHIEDEYGSLTNYLECIGFTSADQARLRKNLLG